MKIQQASGMLTVHGRMIDDATYHGTLEDAQADLGLVLQPLPPGMVSYSYDTERKLLVYYDEFQNAHPVEGEADMPEQLSSVCSMTQEQVSLKFVVRLAHVEALIEDVVRSAPGAVIDIPVVSKTTEV